MRLRSIRQLFGRRHDAMSGRVDRMDDRHEIDFQDLFNRIGGIEDVLDVARERPQSLLLSQILARLDQLEDTARDHYERRDALLAEFLDTVSGSADDAARSAQRLRDSLN